ncbi:RNA pseudouridylate synthase domain containing protein 2 [Gaertneriomyces sp. JEL0708]|nr:RNA pseudouridylate synthase domain containing protein 2 [Gaertneriomyces sp. JEL0708]
MDATASLKTDGLEAGKPTRTFKARSKGRKGLVQPPEYLTPKYYFEGGLRKVVPYPYLYQTYSKGRWQGKAIIEVFAKEFQDKSRQYYEQAIQSGKIKVSGETVDLNYKIGNHDVIQHAVHRHEPPVTADPIEIVYRDEGLIVVNKPSSIPIHPTGRYHHNSVLSILKSAEFGFGDLHPVNRLDRLTSGLCLVALDKPTSVKLMHEFKSRTISKTYLCRVRGEFPEGEIVVDKPILTVSFKLGVNVVSDDGKECRTVFKRLNYNGRTSVVECKPLTGRTHQIRVHLQYLGHPIANDPIYCCDIWGADFGKGGVPKEKIDTVISELTPHVFPQKNMDAVTATLERSEVPSTINPSTEGPASVDPTCAECLVRRADPIPEQLQIYLHSYKYAWDGHEYETPIPAWAKEDYTGDLALVDRFWKYGGKWDGKQPGEILQEE